MVATGAEFRFRMQGDKSRHSPTKQWPVIMQDAALGAFYLQLTRHIVSMLPLVNISRRFIVSVSSIWTL